MERREHPFHSHGPLVQAAFKHDSAMAPVSQHVLQRHGQPAYAEVTVRVVDRVGRKARERRWGRGGGREDGIRGGALQGEEEEEGEEEGSEP